jgi:hypothetical protein
MVAAFRLFRNTLPRSSASSAGITDWGSGEGCSAGEPDAEIATEFLADGAGQARYMGPSV